jgi:hypothetical protein
VSMQTDAVAIAVSQSSGRVRVFDKGELALELDPGGRRGTAEVRAALPKPPRRVGSFRAGGDDLGRPRPRRRLT